MRKLTVKNVVKRLEDGKIIDCNTKAAFGYARTQINNEGDISIFKPTVSDFDNVLLIGINNEDGVDMIYYITKQRFFYDIDGDICKPLTLFNKIDVRRLDEKFFDFKSIDEHRERHVKRFMIPLIKAYPSNYCHDFLISHYNIVTKYHKCNNNSSDLNFILNTIEKGEIVRCNDIYMNSKKYYYKEGDERIQKIFTNYIIDVKKIDDIDYAIYIELYKNDNSCVYKMTTLDYFMNYYYNFSKCENKDIIINFITESTDKMNPNKISRNFICSKYNIELDENELLEYKKKLDESIARTIKIENNIRKKEEREKKIKIKYEEIKQKKTKDALDIELDDIEGIDVEELDELSEEIKDDNTEV